MQAQKAAPAFRIAQHVLASNSGAYYHAGKRCAYCNERFKYTTLILSVEESIIRRLITQDTAILQI
jgi:hypothetical protein